MSRPEVRARRGVAAPDERSWERAGEVLALGHYHRALLRPPFAGEEAIYPRFMVSARGCEIVDERGRTYLDWMHGWGTSLLGHRHPAVEEAIREQLEAGPTASVLHHVELHVAELLVEMIPCAEMVAFGKNGSDALTAAVRVARAHTGRDVILHHGFHGFHDWYVEGYPNLPGVPKRHDPLLLSFPYGDLGALEALLQRHDGAVAAVVMEPAYARVPEPGYLAGVRDLAHRHGALLVFDEIVTGFRLARGGAQELYGVVPDLAAFGKAMANGMPLSAVVGQRRLVQLIPKLAWGMTFSGETLSLAAARATLEILRDEPVVAHLARAGRTVREAFDRACARAGLRATLAGPDARTSFDFEDQDGVGRDRLRMLFQRECVRNGVLTHGALLPTYAHDDGAVRRTIEALEASIGTVADAIRAPGPWKRLFGGAGSVVPLCAPKGFLDELTEDGAGRLRVSGWLLVDDESVERIEVATPTTSVRADSVARPDVAAAHPLARRADRCGFRVLLSAGEFRRGADWEFEIRAVRGEEIVYRARVVRAAGDRSAAHGPYDLGAGTVFAI